MAWLAAAMQHEYKVRRTTVMAILAIPEGWSVLYADPTIEEEQWERKEDLLQLRHHGLDRLVDLGWYGKEFAILVFQGDFHGQQLDEFRMPDESTALEKLHEVLGKWGDRQYR
jgi:hypothetical protein